MIIFKSSWWKELSFYGIPFRSLVTILRFCSSGCTFLTENGTLLSYVRIAFSATLLVFSDFFVLAWTHFPITRANASVDFMRLKTLCI